MVVLLVCAALVNMYNSLYLMKYHMILYTVHCSKSAILLTMVIIAYIPFMLLLCKMYATDALFSLNCDSLHCLTHIVAITYA